MANTCDSCGAPIIWALGADRQGRRLIPIDAQTTLDGNIELTHPEGWDGHPYAKTWGTSHKWPADTPRYRSHFATCPHADQWRRHGR